MVKVLANVFRAVHQAFGITDLPSDATPEQEKRFVLMWLGILALILVWIVFVFYFLSRVL